MFKRVVGQTAKTTQAGIEKLRKYREAGHVRSNIARVIAVHADRGACDIRSWSGAIKYNVPIVTKAGLIDDEVYGEIEFPSVDDYVLVDFIRDRESEPIIVGTLIPYLNTKFQSGQTAVNSSSKQFTLKLLEEGKENFYRKIFRSGTTIEVQDDGTVIVELPSGTYLKLDEAGSELVIEDQHGNIFTLDSNGVKIEDTNGNDVTMQSGKVTVNGNLEVAQ